MTTAPHDRGMRVAVWIGSLIWILAACSGPATTSPSPVAGASPSPAATATSIPPLIKVGVLDDQTGLGATEGALMRISTQLAVDRANAVGGINGHLVMPVYMDPQGEATSAVQMATQLAQQEKVDVLAGGVFSPECQGVQSLAARLKVLYLPLNGCATDALTSKTCDRYTFRMYPTGRQTTEPSVAYQVKTLGPTWAILYPDYSQGQSALATSEAALQKNGGQYATKIAVPFGETNVMPYVTRVPTDGSINVLNVAMTGADLPRVMNAIQQLGINQKMTLVSSLGKESFGGVYPDALNGASITGTRPSDGIPGNADDQKYMTDWLETAKKVQADLLQKNEPDILVPLGGIDHLTPGNLNGYNAYLSMTALILAMRKVNYTGRSDTDKLIAALETLNLPQGPDLPDGPLIMNKDDHQGRTTYYLLKVTGQKEEVVQTFPADQLPLIGDCKITA